MAAPIASLPITPLLPMVAQALRADTGFPMSEAGPLLTSPNPVWVHPGRAGGTSAGSAPQNTQVCTPARNPPVSPLLCWALSHPPSPPCSQPSPTFHGSASIMVLLCCRELYGLSGQSLPIHTSHNKEERESWWSPSLVLRWRQLCLKTQPLLLLASN